MSETRGETARVARRRMSPLARREMLWGLAFLSPWFIGFLSFTLIPMVAAFVFSLTDFNIVRPNAVRFIGLANYLRLLRDPQLVNSMLVTVRFAAISVPIGLAFPLCVAVLVNSPRLMAKHVFRTLFYMPAMIPLVATVMVFQGVLNSQSGWVNRFLRLFGLLGPQWFQDKFWVLPALTIMGFWGIGNTMLTLLAGLQNVPTELHEAARADGAGPTRTFFMITIPMISPVIFYNLILAVIGTFQYFTQAWVISNGRGDPGGATLFYNLYLFKTAFAFNDMGYGATLAWLLFAIVLILTIILFRAARRWVYYAGGEG